ncbi:unnamed protein product [Aphanomyces euteiches]|uniref:FYVE-type domain-containing protein n=1 Tax=Aphanomyces euteiches TaxID=100861 RepID=A0A6G0X8C3_9STRA|nr:hypothetical protein Ae201684_007206 [Aphanomyces euteiches]KAH9101092.1 hypothetical protein Ae201684P_007280 [Aphanomyces euteiches]KAH9139306.1 hypothetical protein AeRB84_016426 [Aphanomyces euteiches]KAH9139428.1 hypothetical protein AeRB84_016306 [Aphanomyces euteiches]
MKLPLPPGFFTTPPLSPHESNEFIEQAYACALDVIDKARLTGGQLLWTQHADDAAGLKIFKGHDIVHESIKYCLAVTEVEGTLDEAAALFATDTSEQLKAYTDRFGKGLLDAAQLYTLVPRSDKAPLEKVSINWTALQSPVGKLTSHRDMCLLECQHAFESGSKQGWVRALKSVNVGCCPDLKMTLGLVRHVIYGTGHVFVESSAPGYLQVFYLIQTERTHGKSRDWAFDMAMKRRCKSLLDLDQFLRENRLSRGSFLPSELLMPKHHRRNCFLCKKKLWPFSGKFNCVKCGEVLCAWCCTLWTVQIHGEMRQIRACSACAQATMKKRNPLRTSRPRRSVQILVTQDTQSSYMDSIKSAPAELSGLREPTEMSNCSVADVHQALASLRCFYMPEYDPIVLHDDEDGGGGSGAPQPSPSSRQS